MWALLSIALFLLVIITFFLPWIHRGKIADLRSELEDLRARIGDIEQNTVQVSAPSPAPPPAYPGQSFRDPWARKDPTPAAETIEEEIQPEEQEKPAEIRQVRYELPQVEAKPGFEMQFGAKLPVWIGGIALALAGFYLVKYSIDVGLLSPAVRLVIGSLFGIGLLFTGHKIRGKENFANGTRIAQALSGAGIADLYVCIFAATNIYHLLPAALGFIGMAAVTGAAVILSLRHGAPIALLGMVGGFLTPALMGSSQPSALLLFGYLYLVLTGLMAVVRRQGWWKLGLLAVAASFLWVVAWMIGSTVSAVDASWLSLFVLMVTGTVFGISSFGQEAEVNAASDKPVASLNNIVAIAGLGLLSCVMTKSGFGLMEWGMFWLLSAGTIAMAYFRHNAYRLLPWLSMGASGLMLFTWNFPIPATYATALLAFTLLYVICGYFLQGRSDKPFFWASVVVAASTGFYTLAYTNLHKGLLVVGNIYTWGFLGLALAAAGIYCMLRIVRKFSDHPEKQHLLTVYAAGVTAFVSLALMITLNRFYFTVSVAAEVLALAWISTRVDIPNLRRLAGFAAGLFAFLILPQWEAGINILFQALFETRASSATRIIGQPLIQLGLPALFFLTASVLLARKKDDYLAKIFEIASILLAALAGHYLVYQVMYPGQNTLHVQPGFIERGLITNIIFLGGFACLWIGGRFGRNVFYSAGLIISLMAAFRVFYLDLMLHNPLWQSSQYVGSLPLVNGLLLTYGLPIFWMSRLRKIPTLSGMKQALDIFSFILAFVLLNFEVRQLFHGAVLTGKTENVEIYTYSAVWLLCGLGLLFFGTLKEHRMMRLASLCLMVLTVGKVFLYDASMLTGLYRVFSFLGLGLCLLGLSWFYSRFVVQKMKV